MRELSLVRAVGVVGLLTLATTSGMAQDAEAPDSLKIYFQTGSDRVSSDGVAVLDSAARLYREGTPIVMIVAGVADTVGSPVNNLALSIRRARAVADGLAARGIPAERLQVLGRGNSELEVPTDDGVPERENRVVEITWR
ncbi:peptidoglycan-associated protein [Oceaniovalibus guishaninsula JLT2003]|uniref:Peptidoglycan-associated protein n=1 Tax=Oceaniovalibus guishaninsula JLT2003 TaxID=1231392 RepID=K2I2T6_9RHOB|nr:OmpA family protein [Oceaniovalibus guishaninsula]EKE43155.1 peptidoglycan-associated protein [Oceaniovalibus guishaninsula JLT2003]